MSRGRQTSKLCDKIIQAIWLNVLYEVTLTTDYSFMIKDHCVHGEQYPANTCSISNLLTG